MKSSRYVLIGIVIVGAIVSLIFGLNYLKGNNYFQVENNYFVKYENVQGLMVSNPVLISGFKVGQIKSIDLVIDEEQTILVELTIDHNILLNDSTIAMISSLDLMGSKGIVLSLGNGKNQLSAGDTLISEVEKDLKEQVSAQMLPLKLKAEDLMVSIEDAMKVVKDIFNNQNKHNIDGALFNLNRTLGTLSHTSIQLDSILTNNRAKLNHIFSNIESISGNLKNNNQQIELIIKNLALVSDSLAKSKLLSTINNANSALSEANQILTKINKGEGSMGQLINNDTLYKHLENSAKDLDRLLIDIRENPKRYIHYSLFDFGKTIVVDEEGLKKEKAKKTKKENKDLSYRLQIKSSKNRIAPNSEEFKHVQNVEEHWIAGQYKYTLGYSPNLEPINQLKQLYIDQFPDAFAVKYTEDSLVSRIRWSN